MKRRDIPVVLIFLLLIAFFSIPVSRKAYETAYKAMPILITFFKFAVMATGGEMVAQRFSTGHYLNRGFGILPKMIIWGLLGISIYWAFVIFSNGAPVLLPHFNKTPEPASRILTAFIISFSTNITFAPMMMLTHHLTDMHIAANKGRFPLRDSPLPAAGRCGGGGRGRLCRRRDGVVFFVIKKTIPLFWIPAHTVTFLLPEQFRTLFAAGLSVVLGILLGALKAKDSLS